MKRILYAFSAALLIAGCAQEKDLVIEPSDGLINVSLEAGTSSDADTKVWAGWYNNGMNYYNLMYWSAGDAIGIFAGDDNVNRRFTLASAPDWYRGNFSGEMMPVPTATTLIAYYPYTEGNTLTRIAFPDIMNQEFEGTFEEKGDFTNYGKYTLLVGGINNFTIDTEWPTGGRIGFSALGGTVRFAITNGLSSPICVRKVGMTSYQYSFIRLTSYNVTNGSLSGYLESEMSTRISDKNPLTIAGSDTKYVQMATAYSDFKANEEIEAFVETLNADGLNVRYVVPKTVSSAVNLKMRKRASVSIPISDKGGCNIYEAKRVKITTSASTLTAPTFTQDEEYQAADTWWGDSTIEPFESGRTHTFTTPGAHSASFNYWGQSNKVTIEKLTGITAIDFSRVN